MSNLDIIQEATIGAFQSEWSPNVQLDSGGALMLVLPPTLGEPLWRVWIAGDATEYEFPDCASAYDFAAEELKLVN